MAISTLKLGKSLDPDNAASWDQRLGNAYNLKINRNEGNDQALPNYALSSFESAYAETATRASQGHLLSNLAKAALKAGELDKAVDYANQMLAPNANSFSQGDLIYNGNFILGMVAIKNGDMDAAAKYLLLSADTSGSAVLNSFGPNMSLAEELLERGQSQVVLAFLKKCTKFWTSSGSPCSEWIQEMEDGQLPHFSMNLNY